MSRIYFGDISNSSSNIYSSKNKSNCKSYNNFNHNHNQYINSFEKSCSEIENVVNECNFFKHKEDSSDFNSLFPEFKNINEVENYENTSEQALESKVIKDVRGNRRKPIDETRKLICMRGLSTVNAVSRDWEHEVIKETENKKTGNKQIRYDIMGGRPSLEILLNEEKKMCLLDTGARMNVIDKKTMEDVKGVLVRTIGKGIFCANGSSLDTLGKVRLNVQIENECKTIEFVVVSKISPSIIAGIDLLERFGIQLVRNAVRCKNNMNEDIRYKRVCSIEAKYGHKITDEMRLENLLRIFKSETEQKLLDIMCKYANVFMANKWDIGKTELVKHEILTLGEPILLKPRRQPANLEDKIEEAIRNLEENGIIRRCDSAWNAPMVCVWKKEKKDIRLCLDFRSLNQITERRAFPMPNIEEMLDTLGDMKYFSTIDLGSAYYQVELETTSQEKTAFSTKTGQFCFNRMPFGIAAAPATFQKLMTMVLGELLWKIAVVYLDDILIFSKTETEHKINFGKVLEKIKIAGLKINPEKCRLLQQEIRFLGHIINNEGVKVDSEKIESIVTFQRPNCIKKLRSFLGLCNYYRKFIKDYAKYARLLESLCGSNKETLMWSDSYEEAFIQLKNSLSKAPVLVYPNFKEEFILDTDASFDTIGAVLSQRDKEGNERVIAYGSHSMSKHEMGYCITRKELLAIYYFTLHFKHYLYGKKFTLRTDHKAITFMLTTKKPITAQFQTWINFLSSLDMDLKYRKGEEHGNADALSRKDCGRCTQCLEVHENAKEGKIKTRLLAMVSEEQGKEWQKESEEINRIMNDIMKGDKRFQNINGVIKTNNDRTWIPKSERGNFVKAIHQQLCHAGANKVLNYIKMGHDMENMKETVDREVKSCELCQKRKTLTVKTKETIKKKEDAQLFEVISIDFCGPLKVNAQGKKYIFGIIDQCSRYITLTAVAKQDERTTAKMLMERWILKFGAPRVIHLDCGKTFESNVIRELAEKYKIHLQYSSPYHHNANGMIERQFRTIRDYVTTSLKDKLKKDWVEILPEVEFVLNTTIQKSIGKTPAEIVFGCKITREWINNKQIDIDRKEVIDQIHEREHKFQYNNSKNINRDFNIGDEVLVKIDIRTKDDDRYMGPFSIIKKLHDRSYEMKNRNGKTLVRNVEWLKPFKRGGCEE